MVLGELGYWIDLRRRHIVGINLRLCFPELSERARKKLRRRIMHAVAKAALLSVAIGRWRTERRLDECVHIRGREHLAAARARGPVIILAPHFLGLEIAALALSREHKLVGMYREPRRLLLHWALHQQRTRYGSVAIERQAGLRPILRLMKEGCPFYYLPDLDPGRAPHVFVPFFGVATATVTAASRFAALAGASVVPCIARQVGLGFEVELLPPLELFPSADEVADTARLSALIEAEIRRDPAQYFWVTKRFKTRPPGMPALY
jgi:KDO2-lipid IV(A) lauroyltransferase